MSQLLARGGNRLEGEVTIQGAKNSVLPVLAATIADRRHGGAAPAVPVCGMWKHPSAFCRRWGAGPEWQGDTLTVDTCRDVRLRDPGYADAGDALLRHLSGSDSGPVRAGVPQLAPAAVSWGRGPLTCTSPACGCWERRSMIPGGTLRCQAGQLTGREIVLGFPSVGATENLMLAACGAEGVTVLSNAAREPEIEDLQNFLNACGGGGCRRRYLHRGDPGRTDPSTAVHIP